jgi:hypothetical protein
VPRQRRSRSERTNIAPAQTVPANWVGTVHGVFPVSDSSGSQSLDVIANVSKSIVAVVSRALSTVSGQASDAAMPIKHDRR